MQPKDFKKVFIGLLAILYMTYYIFVLGRNPELSILEIVAYCKRKKINFGILDTNEEIALLNMQGFDEHVAIKELGGTVKIARPQEDALNYKGTKNKVIYAVNYIKADPQQVDKKIKNLLDQEELRGTRRHGKTRKIDPSKSQHLDFEFIAYRDKIYRTTAVSNPKEYKLRDATRPVYDPLKAISIRLAKILINLAEAKEEVCDPFCGNGTILQEASLMGYLALGVDKEEIAARKNLEWLEQRYTNVKGRWQVFEGDATDLRKFKVIETVVTEPYLGPFHHGLPTVQEAEQIAEELRVLYRKALMELAKKVTGKVVIIFPDLKTRNGDVVSLDMPTIIARSGFKLAPILSSIRNPIPYCDKKDKINRYIYILERSKKNEIPQH